MKGEGIINAIFCVCALLAANGKMQVYFALLQSPQGRCLISPFNFLVNG